MKVHVVLLGIGLAFCLGGCMMFDDTDDVVAPNGCTAAGCPQAPNFCIARGYTPNTDAFHRCVESVEENLRRQ